MLVVGFLLKLQLAAILHELFEFGWVAFAELIQGGLHLLLLNVAIFVVLRAARKSLPGQTASQEVQEYVADCLQIISP
jgi:uncharacterized membrane protein